MLHFPKGFMWGVATSAYQIEGAVNEDGRGESTWDRFAHTPGKIKDGSTGDVACDHYHRWADDIASMQALGIQAYRFSIAWPRILPAGRGAVNQPGIDFYSRLVDGLLAAGIRPIPTLFHWDLPQALQDAGGWPNRDSVAAFTDYADVISRALGDRVKDWITHNEPWCTTMLGHVLGVHAPGLRDWYAGLRTAHHVLLSHGEAAARLRANTPGGRVGIALNFEPAVAASPSSADFHAARWWDGYFHRWFLDPIFGRNYPADMVDYYTRATFLPHGLDFVQPGDLDIIATPLDFFGVNYYTRHVARGSSPDNLPQTIFPAPEAERTQMGWEVVPDTFYDLINRLHFEYRIPQILITENGCSYIDHPDAAGRVADPRRIAFLDGHLRALHRAMQNGAPVMGYLQWSLLDNYEWAEGYTQRFGLVYVDYATQQRVIKDSGYWYRQVIQANALEEP